MIYILKRSLIVKTPVVNKPPVISRLIQWPTYNDFIKDHNPFQLYSGWEFESAFMDGACKYADRNRKFINLYPLYNIELVEGFRDECLDVYYKGIHCIIETLDNGDYKAYVEEYGCFSTNEDFIVLYRSFSNSNSINCRNNGKHFIIGTLPQSMMGLFDLIDKLIYIRSSHSIRPPQPITAPVAAPMELTATVQSPTPSHSILDGYEVHTTREIIAATWSWLKRKWSNFKVWRNRRWQEKHRVTHDDFSL
jgi:hypothetical protein